MNSRFLVFCTLFPILASASFSSPSNKQLELTPQVEIDSLLSIRKLVIDNEFVKKIIETEEAGFIGYHGDSLEFMIYQDIIRLVMEHIVEVPIRADFHFFAVPLDPQLKIQTKEELVEAFKGENPLKNLYDTTFPLNFTIYDNANRLGLNTLENFTKNQSAKPLGYKKRLIWLFNQLGIDEDQIEVLFAAAYSKLSSQNGIILQVFDDSDYSFSKKIAYPAYPNGFISSNVTIDEYFLDDSFLPPYPHEVRLLLTHKETLNPHSPLKIVRHLLETTKSQLSSYERSMNKKIKRLSFSPQGRDAYRSDLLKVWE